MEVMTASYSEKQKEQAKLYFISMVSCTLKPASIKKLFFCDWKICRKAIVCASREIFLALWKR